MNKYNGWSNYATWNVALWIQNDENLYNIAFRFKDKGYKAFANSNTPIGDSTPDGIAWNDSSLDISELDALLKEMYE